MKPSCSLAAKRVLAASILALAVAVAGCTPRSDSSTSTATAAHMEAMRAQIDLLTQKLNESAAARANTSTQISQPAPQVTLEDLQRLRDRISDLQDRMLTRRDTEAIQLSIENLQTSIKTVTASGADLQARYEALLKSAASREDLSSGLARLDSRLSEYSTRLSTMETDLTTKLGELVTRLSQMTSPGGNSAAIADLQARVAAAEAARADVERQLAAQLEAEKEYKKKIQEQTLRIQELLDKNNELQGTATNPDAVAPTNPPNSVAGGAVNGEVLQVLNNNGAGSEITAMVKFPPTVPFIEGAQYNVFDRKGRKTGDFVVVSNSTPPERSAREQWFGGYIRLLKRDVVPMEKDRVTNLMKVPNLDDIPGNGGNTPPGGSSDPNR